MEILVFEWFVGGGLLQDATAPDLNRSIVQEALAMAAAICPDLVQAGHTVHLPVDHRVPNEWYAEIGVQSHSIQNFGQLPLLLREIAGESGAIIVIAPESDGRLLMALQWLEDFQNNLVSPVGEIVQIGNSKQKTVQWLESHGVQKPFEIDRANPVVVKPDDGAGSDGVMLLPNPNSIPQFVRDQPSKWRTERLLIGLPVSLSVIGGPNGYFLFPPTIQVFEESPRLECERPETIGMHNENQFGNIWPGPWTGFDYPVEEPLAERAVALCERALTSLPEFTGYIGMDLILADDGADEDRIIDLNPRMTTSWVGLRQLYSSNLGEFMINHARGINCVMPVLKSKELRFRLQQK